MVGLKSSTRPSGGGGDSTTTTSLSGINGGVHFHLHTLFYLSSHQPMTHAVEPSKPPNDNHLEDYYKADEEEDCNESEFVADFASPEISATHLTWTFHLLF